MKKINFILAVFIVLLIMQGCEEPYDPPAISAANNFLVVEGSITSGTSEIRISRTRNFSDKGGPVLVSDAVVSIESNASATFAMTSLGAGKYSVPIILNPAEQYRLKIEVDGKQYVSDFMEVKNAPPVGDVTWESTEHGIQIYVHTSDPSNNTRYYRWTYEEAWEFHSAYQSYLIYVNDTTKIFRTPQDDIYTCYNSAQSSSIILGSSASLSSDIIYKLPIHFVTLNTNRLQVTYSILVNQYALDKMGYEYWENLRRMTEITGSLFDQQPSQLRGNIRCLSDDKEIVVGYINVGNTSEKRIFVKKDELPSDFPSRIVTGYKECSLYEENPDLHKFYAAEAYIPVSSTLGKTYYGTRACVDCRMRGTKTKPNFWP